MFKAMLFVATPRGKCQSPVLTFPEPAAVAVLIPTRLPLDKSDP